MMATVHAISRRLETVEGENAALSHRLTQMQSYISILENQLNLTDNYATSLDLRLTGAENELRVQGEKLFFQRTVIDAGRSRLNKTRLRVKKMDEKLEKVDKVMERWKKNVNTLDETFLDVRGLCVCMLGLAGTCTRIHIISMHVSGH